MSLVEVLVGKHIYRIIEATDLGVREDLIANPRLQCKSIAPILTPLRVDLVTEEMTPAVGMVDEKGRAWVLHQGRQLLRGIFLPSRVEK